MDHKTIISLCKDLGCCDACCIRYTGVKNPTAYGNPQEYIHKLQNSTELSSEPVAKKTKPNRCVSCLGILQPDSWDQVVEAVKTVLEEKRYDCKSMAAALSAPITTLLREKVVMLHLAKDGQSAPPTPVPLKEAWKWSFCHELASHIGVALDSGAISPLLVTITLEYADDVQELDILKTLSPNHFNERSKQKKRFTIDFTRRSVEQALDGVELSALEKLPGYEKGLPEVSCSVTCVSVTTARNPVYLGGRYIKLSRELPQTPWVVAGQRMMDTSVQEIIFQPIAKVLNLSPSECDHRLKFISAGREDVDVRCLGDGRPFAIEIADPRRELNKEELASICEEISKDGRVIVKTLVHINKDQLTELKKGEETKSKTYNALCIKLAHGDGDDASSPIKVTPSDIERINASGLKPIEITQKTPIRVLHRRPLLTRQRALLSLAAEPVPDHPQLLTLKITTTAGTYVKEWVHSDLGRTQPSLKNTLGAPADLLALDVSSVHLQWPPTAS